MDQRRRTRDDTQVVSSEHLSKNARVRPLPLSDFVVEQFPYRLAAVRESRERLSFLLSDVRLLLEKITFDQIAHEQDARMWRIVLLDLKILEAGLVHTARLCSEEIRIPDKLLSLITVLSCNLSQPTILTYEEIVLENPEKDMRTFTFPYHEPVTECLQTSRRKRKRWLPRRIRLPFSRNKAPTALINSEEQFYAYHRTIEAHMGHVLLFVRSAVISLVSGGTAEVRSASLLLSAAVDEMAWIQQYAKDSFQRLRNEDFLLFREYLREHPCRVGPGASGAGSPSFAELDIRLRGIHLPEEDLRDVRTHMPYYSSDSRTAIAIALAMAERGWSIMSISEAIGHPTALEEALGRLTQSLRIWRSIHYRIVADHLPDVMRGLDVGTGGKTDTHRYLHHKLHLHDTRAPTLPS